MANPKFDVTPFLTQVEGQHFDRKSMLEGPPGEKRSRDRREMRRQAAEYVAAFRQFVASLGNADLSRQEFRALLIAHRRGRVDNAALRSVTGLDTLRASHLLRGLRDRELLTLQGRGADSFYTLTPVVRDLAVDRGELPADRGELRADRGELPADVQRAVDGLGPRPRKERLRAVIEAICEAREWTTSGEIARFLNFSQRNLSGRHLTPMVEAGRLVRRYPDNPTHPKQAYRSASPELPSEEENHE